MVNLTTTIPGIRSYVPTAEESEWLATFEDNLSAWAALYYAMTFNSLDFGWIEPFLSTNVSYESQSVFERLEGLEAVGDYLGGKIVLLKEHGSNARLAAELGTTPDRANPCVIFYQAQGTDDANWRSRPIAYAELRIESERVESIFMVSAVPDPKQAKRSGLFPLAELDETIEVPVKLPLDAELEFRVYLLDGEIGIDKAMLAEAKTLADHFRKSRIKVIKGMSGSEEDFQDCVDRGIVGFPTLIVEHQSRHLLRFDGLHSAQDLIEAIEKLF